MCPRARHWLPGLQATIISEDLVYLVPADEINAANPLRTDGCISDEIATLTTRNCCQCHNAIAISACSICMKSRVVPFQFRAACTSSTDKACHQVETGTGEKITRTNLSSCLGLWYNGQMIAQTRLLILVPHEGTHGTMCLMKKLPVFRPKIIKWRVNKKAMPLIPNNPGEI